MSTEPSVTPPVAQPPAPPTPLTRTVLRAPVGAMKEIRPQPPLEWLLYGGFLT